MKQNPKKQSGSCLNNFAGLRGKRICAELPEVEWNFEAVDDSELMACCLWEYARESNVIRQVIKTVKTALANQGKPCPQSAERDEFNKKIQTAFGILARVGFDVVFWTALGFPKPWQQVDPTQRKKWAQFSRKAATQVQFPPFQVTGDLNTATALHRQAKDAHELQGKLYSIIHNDATDLAMSSELRKELSKTFTPPVVKGEGGVNSFIAQINWHDFTDSEIKKSFCEWVDKNRPPSVGHASLRGKKKETRERVMLDRLAIMRLLHHTTLTGIEKEYPAAWKRFKGDSTDWYRSRKNASNVFSSLFPFLGAKNVPRSYKTKGSHK